MFRWTLTVSPAVAQAGGRWLVDLGAGDPVAVMPLLAGVLGQALSLWQPVVLVAAVIGLGDRPARWLAPRAGGRVVPALLVGFGIGSLIAQGLALAGVADPRLFIAAVVLAGVHGVIRSARLRAWRAWLPTGPGEAAPAFAVLIVLLISWAVSRLPDLFEDGMAYHLAAPEQWLSLRRIVAEPQSVAWHFMLGSEALTMPLLAAGGVVGGKLLTVAAAAALPVAVRALALAAGASSAGAAWSAALAATSAFLPAACWGVKNDLLAAVLAAGAVWAFMNLRRGRDSLAGLAWWLLGSAIAVKTTAGLVVPAVAAILFAPGSRFRIRSGVPAPLLGILPPAGWALRNWLHLGNPAYPFLSGIFPTLAWGPDYLDAVAVTQRAFGNDGAFARSYIPVVPPSLLLDPSFGSPALAVALGVVLVAGAPGLRVALLAGFAGWVATHRVARYLGPFMPVLAAAAGPALGRHSPGPSIRRAVAGLLVVPPLVAAVLAAPPPAWRAWAGVMSPDAFLAGRFTTWEGIRRWTRGAAPPGKALLTGDERRLGFGRRVISAVGPCQPLLWTWSRESADASRLRLKLRQAGIGLIIHNYVAAEFRMLHWYRAHAWTPAQLAVYAAFARRWLRPVPVGGVTDFANGAWIVFDVTSSPGRFPAYFLPQTECRWKPVRDLAESDRIAMAPADARRIAAPTAGVRQDEHMEGWALLAAGRFAEAERVLRPGIADGFTGNGNVDEYAGALASLGRMDEAVRWQARSLLRLRAADAVAAYSAYLTSRARDRREPRGDWRGALRDSEAAAMIQPDRWETWALAAGYAARLERFGDAAAHARRALALNPDHPGLAGMVRELETLAHTTISR